MEPTPGECSNSFRQRPADCDHRNMATHLSTRHCHKVWQSLWPSAVTKASGNFRYATMLNRYTRMNPGGHAHFCTYILYVLYK